ncbi:hypothetical protein CgunFtcFv8_013444 [Champsocephalus gunnari]|uniref:Uncharacterized protein n=1 Tax=Champsocephalus gunnari TaxID=52237 RepID=A0AAN8DSF5_CHAGU|nr:hypothetical protein CgunFtcFv8_013444 [Champsocephalus gunnari]
MARLTSPLPPLSASFPSNYGSSHPESRGQRWTRLAAERLMAGNGEGRMNPGQMGINKETGLKDASCYGQRGAGGWGGGRNAGTSGQITCLISHYVSSIGGVPSAA